MALKPNNPFEYDVVIVGSGFGGSTVALRLTEEGYRVLVLEAGRRFNDADFPKGISGPFCWRHHWAVLGFNAYRSSRMSWSLSGIDGHRTELANAVNLFSILKTIATLTTISIITLRNVFLL
jgi:choline dehydrogenase-like flavoprotein